MRSLRNNLIVNLIYNRAVPLPKRWFCTKPNHDVPHSADEKTRLWEEQHAVKRKDVYILRSLDWITHNILILEKRLIKIEKLLNNLSFRAKADYNKEKKVSPLSKLRKKGTLTPKNED